MINSVFVSFLCRKGTQVEWRYTEQGLKVRVSKRTGYPIPVPVTSEETIDFKTRAGYTGGHYKLSQIILKIVLYLI